MSLINQTIKEEQFILEDESHEDDLKELDGMQFIKQEPFSSLDENVNEPCNISGLERKQSLVMEQACDIEIKSEPSPEESKPVIKEQVAVALFTSQEGVALPADDMKELDGMQFIKQEPFSSLDENVNEPCNISGLERKQSLVMEQACDIEMKSEPPLEESKPVIKDQVAVALFTSQEGVTLPAIQVKTETCDYISEDDTKHSSTLAKPQYGEETEERYIQNEIFQDYVTKNSHGLYPEELQRIDNAHEESASTEGAEINVPEVIESNLRGGKHQKKQKKKNLRGEEHKSASCQVQEILFCDFCGKSFSQKRYLARHISSHLNKEPSVGIRCCDLCGKSFSQRSHLVRHMRSHKSKGLYVCNKCGVKCSRPDTLKRHKTLHIPAEKVPLSECIPRPFICDVCDKGFRNRHDLKRHSVIHVNPKTYLCDRCGQTFTQLSDMKRHATVHTGRELQKCETCGKSFQKRMSLLRHQVHHNKDKMLHCNFCGRSFTRKDCLNSHLFQHLPQKPFVCKYCGKGYSQAAALKVHIYNHLGQKPFSCPDCEKYFTSASALRRHSLRMHTFQQSSKDIKLQQM